MNVDSYQPFNCPKCGAPGSVSYGFTRYTCMCRMAGMTFQPLPPDTDGCQPLRPLTEEAVRKIVREEIERAGLGKGADHG